MNYFEFYAGDYLRDTADLSLAEHGAYLLLMATYYSSECPLAPDVIALNRIARAMSKPEQAAVAAVAGRFFPLGEDGLRHNGRADREIEKAQKRIISARENGTHGGRPKKPKPNPDVTHQKPTGFQSGTPESNPPETHSGEALQTPRAKEQKATEATASVVPSEPGPRHCPQSEIVSMYHEILPSLQRVRDWTPARQGYLRKRWLENAERQSLDWWRSFFEYVQASDFLMGRKAGRSGEPFECDLEWLVRPKNFVKVIEGKYENRKAA